MQCYTELTPPTAVTHALTLALTSAHSRNLVVAKSSLLQVFETKEVAADLDAQQPDASSTVQAPYAVGGAAGSDDDGGLDASFLGGDAALLRADRSLLTKLVLVAEFPLAGTVTGLARIQLGSSGGGAATKSGGDALLLAFKDARLSLVEWDPETHELATISIHYYEQDELQGAPWAAPLSDYANFLAADPGSRCAALRFGARNLAILPFRQADDDDDDDDVVEGADGGEDAMAMDDDWDEELDGPRPARAAAATAAAAAAAAGGRSAAVVSGPGSQTKSIEDTPFSPSFVLRLSNLDPALLHPVHLAFLHEYREPTFGILSSAVAPSTVLGRRDRLVYMVFTLDLAQRASTTILSVAHLPQDLVRIFPVPAPIGGALLLGTNELIHVDQSGRANGVAVNAFAKQTTSFGLADQADLALRLEGCRVEMLSPPEAGELLLVLHDGRLAVVTLRVDGRVVSGVSVAPVAPEAGGDVLLAGVSCLSRLGRQALFAGSEDTDSVVLGYARKQVPVARRKPKDERDGEEKNEEEEDEEEEDMEEDDDDLYGEGPGTTQAARNGAHGASATPGKAGTGGGELSFRVHDQLISLAPIRDMTYGRPPPPASTAATEEAASKDAAVAEAATRSDLSLVCAVGRGRAGALALINRGIQAEPIGVFAFPEAQAVWTVSASRPVARGEKEKNDDYESPAQYDQFMIVAKEDEDGFEASDVYAVTGTGFEKLAGTEFEPAAGFTVQAGTMGRHKRIIQVLKSEVRCYDGDLGLSQILPMVDEDTGAEPRVVRASIADPYLLLVRDDGSAVVAEMNKDLELEELEHGDGDASLAATSWAAGCLYTDTTGVFGGRAGSPAIRAFLLSTSGQLCIYALPELRRVYAAEGLTAVPPVFGTGFAARRGMAKAELAELLVADLGDAVAQAPYLVLRHADDDLTLYEPVRWPVAVAAAENETSLDNSLRFVKVPNTSWAETPARARPAPPPAKPEAAGEEEETAQRDRPLRACGNIGGYSTVFLPGRWPRFVIKSARSRPRVVALQQGAAAAAAGGVRSLSSFHTEGCQRGFLYVDGTGTSRVCTLPAGEAGTTSLAEAGGAVVVRKVALGAEAVAVAYHAPSGAYAVGSGAAEAFGLPRDDVQRAADWGRESLPAGMAPTGARGRLLLVSPVRWTVVDSVAMEAHETILCVQTVNLEVSEATNERRPLVVVGTAIGRGEDLAVRGRVLVFDVVAVIPEPGRPETGRKLKLVAEEEIPRGAVTAVSGIGTQGLLLVAQGQKCLVRGLKEDGTLLPVAFMDMNCYVTAAKELPGTGLCVLADAFKGVWFAGYTEEPYKLMLFGKSHARLETVCADLLPDGGALLLVAADPEGNLHVLQFDPEHPKSLQGHLLLHRATFCAGAHVVTTSLLLPSTGGDDKKGDSTDGGAEMDDGPDEGPRHHLLLASPTGLLAALVPLPEAAYRRLASLAGQLATALAHTAGLNPRGHRLAAGGNAATLAPGVDAAVGRSVVDGALLARWAELGAGRQGEMAGRAGFASAAEARAALAGVLGWSSQMAYF